MGCRLTLHCHKNFIRICLIFGGSKNIAAQATELQPRLDVLVATPGQLLDDLLNFSEFDLKDLELLVLDEADWLLDLGFREELEQILKFCEGQRRQTMLFSATMEHTKVDNLNTIMRASFAGGPFHPWSLRIFTKNSNPSNCTSRRYVRQKKSLKLIRNR